MLPLPAKESMQPAPPSDDPGGQESVDYMLIMVMSIPSFSQIAKDRVHALEGSLITWTKQVKHVLKQQPEDALRDPTKNPEPLVEVQFWRVKANNLNSVVYQVEK